MDKSRKQPWRMFTKVLSHSTRDSRPDVRFWRSRPSQSQHEPNLVLKSE